MWWSVCICVYKTIWIMKNLFLLFHINLYIFFSSTASFVENSTLKKQIFHHMYVHALWTRDNFHGKFFFFSFIKIKWVSEREREKEEGRMWIIYTHMSQIMNENYGMALVFWLLNVFWSFAASKSSFEKLSIWSSIWRYMSDFLKGFNTFYTKIYKINF